MSVNFEKWDAFAATCLPAAASMVSLELRDHARAKSGYDMKQLVAEYRALRASVLAVWIDACAPATPLLQDVMRFNEAIDQAVAESVGHFSAQLEQARDGLHGAAFAQQVITSDPLGTGSS